MGAALHLAEVHQTPPAPARKRGGGGGGSDYDYIVAKVYRDQRQTAKSRELILLLAWLKEKDPDRNPQVGERKNMWARANAILNPGVEFSRRRPPRLADLIASDAPRYEMDWRRPENQGRACRAPMIRRAGECGQHGVDAFTRIDPATGWGTTVWTCNRHRAWGNQQHRLETARPRVEPIPNAGGLLPCYFRWSDEKWIELYRWALTWQYERGWKPPSYGLRADGWPTPGTDLPALAEGEQPRLFLAATDGELLPLPDLERPK